MKAIIVIAFFSIINASVAFDISDIDPEGCQSIIIDKKKDYALKIETEKLSDKKIKVHFFHGGNFPVGLHIPPDPNIIFSFPQNKLTHEGNNKLGPIILSKSKSHHSFTFNLKNKFKKTAEIFFNNERTKHLGFKADLIKPLSPPLKLCSRIKS